LNEAESYLRERDQHHDGLLRRFIHHHVRADAAQMVPNSGDVARLCEIKVPEYLSVRNPLAEVIKSMVGSNMFESGRVAGAPGWLFAQIIAADNKMATDFRKDLKVWCREQLQIFAREMRKVKELRVQAVWAHFIAKANVESLWEPVAMIDDIVKELTVTDCPARDDPVVVAAWCDAKEYAWLRVHRVADVNVEDVDAMS